MPHNVFEGNTYKYILTSINVASRYKFARSLKNKKPTKLAFVLEVVYKKSGVLKYPRVIQCDNGSEFKDEVTKLLQKHNVAIRRATTKYKHTHKTFVEPFNKELTKLLLNPMDAQDYQASNGLLIEDEKDVLAGKYRKSPAFAVYHILYRLVILKDTWKTQFLDFMKPKWTI